MQICRRSLMSLFLAVGLIALGSGLLHPRESSAEEAGDTETGASAGVQTVIAKRGPLGASIETKGTLEPLRHEGVACRPKAYRGPLKIAETAKEGRVVKGQTLVRFDEEEYSKQLLEQERSLALSRNRLEKREREFKIRQREAAVALDDAARRKRQADEALERYLSFERKAREDEAVLRFVGYRNQLKDQQEELEQLEKMYNEDDLTEETEEIVLNRARRGLERTLKYFAFRKNRHDYNMEVLLPRQHESLRLTQRKTTNALDRVQATQGLDMAKAEMELEDARKGYRKKEEAFEKFRADRDRLTLKAPLAGYAVAGSFSGGKWSGLGSRETTLAPEKAVKAGQILFTVVDESVFRVRSSVKEADLLDVSEGGVATVTCALTGKDAFEAVVESIARYGAGGNYAVTLRLTSKDKRLRTGLACGVKILRSNEKDVLSVPLASVLEDEGSSYVFVRDEDGSVNKTKIETGAKVAGRVEIRSGLKAGQRLLASPPAVSASEDETEQADAKK